MLIISSGAGSGRESLHGNLGRSLCIRQLPNDNVANDNVDQRGSGFLPRPHSPILPPSCCQCIIQCQCVSSSPGAPNALRGSLHHDIICNRVCRHTGYYHSISRRTASISRIIRAAIDHGRPCNHEMACEWAAVYVHPFSALIWHELQDTTPQGRMLNRFSNVWEHHPGWNDPADQFVGHRNYRYVFSALYAKCQLVVCRLPGCYCHDCVSHPI